MTYLDKSLRSTSNDLHKLYCRLTRLDLPMTTSMGYAWEAWSLHFTAKDTETLILWMQSQARKRLPVRSTSFRNLISGAGSIDYAYEDLAKAKAEARAYQPPPKPTFTPRIAEEVKHTAQPIAKLIGDDLKAFMTKCRQENGV